MGLTLVSNPAKTKSSIESRLNASLSQVPYELIRKDDTFTSYSDSGGYTLLNGVDDTLYTVNDKVYVQNSDEAIKGIYTVTAKATGTITLDLAYTGSLGATGYVNNRTSRYDYRVQVYVLDSAGDPLHDDILSFVPKVDGSLFIDLSALVSFFCLASTVLQFKIKYREWYEGAAQSFATDPDMILGVYARKSLQAYAGANMWDFMLDTSVGYQKFARDFETKEAIFYKDWTNKLYYFIDLDFSTREAGSIEMIEESLNINGTLVSSRTTAAVSTVGLHALSLTKFASGVYHRVYLQTVVGSNLLSEKFDFLYEEDNCQKPLMIEWLNSVGGINTWRFNHNQLLIEEITGIATLNGSITQDIETEEGSYSQYSGNLGTTIAMTADNLTLNQARVLYSIKRSPSIWLWLKKDGSQKVKVIVEKEFSSTYDTRAERKSVSLIFRLPDNFDLFSTLDYTF